MKEIPKKQLLNRVNLKISLLELAGQIVAEFNLGRYFSFQPLPVGYEELNCLLETANGKMIVKIFSKDKDLRVIKSNVTSLLEYYMGGVPVPQLYQNSAGKYLFQIKNNPGVYLIVMDYFDGKKFTETEPTKKDLINLTKILAKIHQLKFATHANYDSWLTIHLPKEFKSKKQYLSNESLTLIRPVVEQTKVIDYQRLTQSIVHFDLHRENAMKDRRGHYCILDLASTDFNYKVFDLATFIALFGMDSAKPFGENIRRKDLIVKTYLSAGQLNQYEQSILPLLIKATFASNLLIPEYLQKTGQDANPEQTVYYKSMGLGGLKMLK